MATCLLNVCANPRRLSSGYYRMEESTRRAKASMLSIRDFWDSFTTQSWSLFYECSSWRASRVPLAGYAWPPGQMKWAEAEAHVQLVPTVYYEDLYALTWHKCLTTWRPRLSSEIWSPPMVIKGVRKSAGEGSYSFAPLLTRHTSCECAIHFLWTPQLRSCRCRCRS